MTHRPDLVLFDLGGVLIELQGVADLSELAGIEDPSELWRRWLGCRWVRTFESGRCSADEFAAGVIEDWALPIGGDEFLERFAAWPTGPLPGAEELVRATSAKVITGCLSNTNAIHWDGNVERWTLLSHLSHQFVSHRMGLVKPDAEVFMIVAGSVPAPPHSTLFLDDNLVNVEAAREAGFRAEQVSGVEDARAVLVSAGILDGDSPTERWGAAADRSGP